MRILAIDTSTDWLSVAAGDGAMWHARQERAGSANSERLLPAVHAVLAEAQWRLADLDGIAFGAGPGAFTGVRIACSVAQGLAFGIDRPVVAISTLAALSQSAWRERGCARVVACLDARMREIYLAAYVRENDGWRTVQEPVVVKPDDAPFPDGADWQGEGDGFAAYPALADHAGLRGTNPAAIPTARAVGELALPQFAANLGVPAAEARPLYVRHRVALTTAERAAGARL